ncbi:hypothetical protein ES703_92628 [subsurface metagenome]
MIGGSTGIISQAINSEILVVIGSKFSVPARVDNFVRQPDGATLVIHSIRIISVESIHILDDVLVHFVDKLEAELEVSCQLVFNSGDKLIHIGSFEIIYIKHEFGFLILVRS